MSHSTSFSLGSAAYRRRRNSDLESGQAPAASRARRSAAAQLRIPPAALTSPAHAKGTRNGRRKQIGGRSAGPARQALAVPDLCRPLDGCRVERTLPAQPGKGTDGLVDRLRSADADGLRSEEHTSELQSRENLVCRL